MTKRILVAILCVASVLLALTSCGAESGAGKTLITLSAEGIQCESPAVSINDDGCVTITSAGVYELTGELNGQIYVNCADAGELTLVLNNVDIFNEDGACIVIMKAQTARVTLAKDSVNTLRDGGVYTFPSPEETEPDAALYSKEDLVIDGEGELIIETKYGSGIVSKDGLIIESGLYTINSANHGIKGKDYLKINGGDFTIVAVGDGLKSNNPGEVTAGLVGYVEINGGNITIDSADEGIQAAAYFTMHGGKLTLNSENNGIKCADEIEFTGGEAEINVAGETFIGYDVFVSEDASVTVNGVPYNE